MMQRHGSSRKLAAYLGEEYGFHVAHSTINTWAKGKTEPSEEAQDAIAKALNRDVLEFRAWVRGQIYTPPATDQTWYEAGLRLGQADTEAAEQFAEGVVAAGGERPGLSLLKALILKMG